MNFENVNLPALREALRDRASRSKALKRRLRTTWTEPMVDHQHALVALRRETTRLLVLRAWLRGRFHLLAPPRDGWSAHDTWDRERYHREVSEAVAREYAYGEAS